MIITDLFVFGLRVSQAAVASESPREGPVALVDGDGVVGAAGDLLDDDPGDGGDTLGLGVFLHVHNHLGRHILIVERHLAGFLQELAVGVVAKLAVLGVSYEKSKFFNHRQKIR